MPDTASLRPLFHPNSFAIIGASSDPVKYGGRPVSMAMRSGYGGKVYPINRNSPEVQGLKAYPTVKDVGAPVDCAFIAIPGNAVEGALQECADAGVKAAVVVSAGFAEIGPEGAERQQKMTDIARASGMRIIGPNCMGLFQVRHKFYCTFAGSFMDPKIGWPKPGNLAIVSQSGAFGMHAFTLAHNRGLGISTFVTTGNEADVEFGECLEYLAEDDETEVILGYLEGSRNRETLKAGLAKARERGKPVIILKVGRSSLGQRAAASHTGSLVGSDAAYDALFRQYGAYRAATIDELMDVAAGCCGGRYPSKPRVGLLSISGGVNVVMADAATKLGISVPPLPAKAQEKLRSFVPHATVRNPLDTTGMWSVDNSLFEKFLTVLLEDGGHDAVVVFGSTMGLYGDVLQRVREGITPLRQKYPDRLMMLSIVTSPDKARELEEDGFLVYEDPDRAIEVLGALNHFKKVWSRRLRIPRVPRDMPSLPSGLIGEAEALKVLAKAGIPVVRHRLAAGPGEAGAAAKQIGFPVVLKVASPDILHKTEIGGVALGIDSQSAARRSATQLLARAKKAAPKARLDGVLVARQESGGVETILGAQVDPALGPVVMFGLGGIFVEVFEDVALRTAPVGVDEARAMIHEIKGFPLLAGARGRGAFDVDAVAQAISRLSLFVAANESNLESIDINPFIVRPAGKGAVAADAVIVPARRRRG